MFPTVTAGSLHWGEDSSRIRCQDLYRSSIAQDLYRVKISIALAIHSLDPIRSLDLFASLITPYSVI